MTLPYFRDFAKDWLGETTHLTHAEKGVYQDLRALIWSKGVEGTLPGDDASISRLLGMPVREWKRYKAVLVEGDFAVLGLDERGRLYDRHLLAEYAHATTKSNLGRKAATERWGSMDAPAYAFGHASAYASASPNAAASATPKAHANGNATRHADGNARSDADAYADGDPFGDAIPDIKNLRYQSLTGGEKTLNPHARAMLAPKRYEITQRHLTWAIRVGYIGTLSTLQVVADNFVDHMRGDRRMSFDWDSEFRKWVRREVGIQQRDAAKGKLLPVGDAVEVDVEPEETITRTIVLPRAGKTGGSQ